ncbi:MAG: rRNA maturation RNase YbeY [Steroidobacteraceae bacterium]
MHPGGGDTGGPAPQRTLAWQGPRHQCPVLPGPGRLSSGEWLLGDIVICAPVLAREARQQGKTLEAHWAHIAIHGVLHLLGFDHERPRQARQMEDLEVQILEGIGFSDPYGPF